MKQMIRRIFAMVMVLVVAITALPSVEANAAEKDVDEIEVNLRYYDAESDDWGWSEPEIYRLESGATYQDLIELLSDPPTVEGLTFVEWKIFDDEFELDEVIEEDSVMFEAVYDPREIEVDLYYYDAEEDSWEWSGYETYWINSDTTYQELIELLPAPPTFDGLTFVKWKIDDGEYELTDVIEGDYVDFKAVYDKKDVNVDLYYYDAEEDSWEWSGYETYWIEWGATYQELIELLPAPPTVEGLTFVKWVDFYDEYELTDVIEEDYASFEAVYDPREIEVDLKYYDAEVDSWEWSGYETYWINSDTTYQELIELLPAPPTVEGLTFVEWVIFDDEYELTDVIEEDSLDFKAVYDKKDLEVGLSYYDAEEDEWYGETLYFWIESGTTYQELIELLPNPPSSDELNFVKWKLTSSHKMTDVIEEDWISFQAFYYTGSVEVCLYALNEDGEYEWSEDKTYEIPFGATYQDLIDLLPDPLAVDGNTFVKWDLYHSDGYELTDVIVDEYIDLVAVYDKRYIQIDLYSLNEYGYMSWSGYETYEIPDEITYEELAELLPNPPAVNGFKFVEWKIAGDGYEWTDLVDVYYMDFEAVYDNKLIYVSYDYMDEQGDVVTGEKYLSFPWDQIVTYDDLIDGLVPDESYEGVTFLGWDSSVAVSDDEFSGDYLHLEACYDKYPVTVEYIYLDETGTLKKETIKKLYAAGTEVDEIYDDFISNILSSLSVEAWKIENCDFNYVSLDGRNMTLVAEYTDTVIVQLNYSYLASAGNYGEHISDYIYVEVDKEIASDESLFAEFCEQYLESNFNGTHYDGYEVDGWSYDYCYDSNGDEYYDYIGLVSNINMDDVVTLVLYTSNGGQSIRNEYFVRYYAVEPGEIVELPWYHNGYNLTWREESDSDESYLNGYVYTVPEDAVAGDMYVCCGYTLNLLYGEADDSAEIEDEKDVLSSNVSLQVVLLENGFQYLNTIQVIENQLGDVGNVAVFDIVIVDEDGMWLEQLEDVIKVTIDLPYTVGEGKTIQVFRVNGENLIPCETTVADGKVSFFTDHFSTYVFVEVEDEQPPAGGEQPPAGGEQPPAGGEQPPAGGEQPPAGGEQPPAGGEQPPAGGEQPPAGGEQPPAGGEQPPAGGEQPPAGDDNTGGDNTGGDNTGDNAGGDNTGDNAGGDNTGDNAGGDNAGDDNTGGNDDETSTEEDDKVEAPDTGDNTVVFPYLLLLFVGVCVLLVGLKKRSIF